MKSFNLKDAQAGHSICTREGWPVTIKNINVNRNDFPICAEVHYPDATVTEFYTIDGHYYYHRFNNSTDNMDLMMK